MIEFHMIEDNIATVATKRHTHTLPYGIAEIEETQILHLREKPSFHYFINAGVYVINPEVLNRISNEQTVDMPDIVQELIDANQRVGSFAVHEYWIDIGTLDKYEQVQNDYLIHFGLNNE